MPHGFKFLLLEASSLFQDCDEEKFPRNISASSVWQAGSILTFSAMREGKDTRSSCSALLVLQRPGGKETIESCNLLEKVKVGEFKRRH